MSFSIRPATADDSEQIVALADSVASEERWIVAQPGDTTALEETARWVELVAHGGLSLVAESEGRVAGHLIGRHTQDGDGEVGLIVGSGFRRQGLGEALMNASVAWARLAGITKLTLSVFSDNEPAIALYQKLGFVQEGIEKDRYMVGGLMKDAILMGLELQ